MGAPESVGNEDLPSDADQPTDLNELVFDASAGSDYTLVILNDRTAAVAGYIEDSATYEGHFGIKGTDLTPGVNVLQRIEKVINSDGVTVDAPEFKQVVAGVGLDGPGKEREKMHSVFIDMNGNVYATGYNNMGQLCLGNEDKSLLPKQIGLPPGERAVSVAVGGEFTLVHTDSGKMYGCGTNAVGQLGLGVSVSKTDTPTLIADLSGVTSVSAGLDFSLIMAGDDIFVMGRNAVGQLCNDPLEKPAFFTPTKLSTTTAVSPVAMTAAFQSSYILFDNGSVRACGLNDVGQLGDGTSTNSITTSVDFSGITPLPDIVNVFAGPSAKSAFFEAAADGKLYGTGLNDRGQLGVGNKVNSNVPLEVNFSADGDVPPGVGVSASDSHTLAW
ncbi:hypothetical protein ACHAXR_010397 [Thalassiosira sp. AJA248-18]